MCILLLSACSVPGCGSREGNGSKVMSEGLTWWSSRYANYDREHFRKRNSFFAAGNKMTLNLDRLIWTCLWDFLLRCPAKSWKSSLTLLWLCAMNSSPMSPGTPNTRKRHDLARWPWARHVRWNSDEILLAILNQMEYSVLPTIQVCNSADAYEIHIWLLFKHS